MYYLLFYEKAPDYASREVAWRDSHRTHVLAAADSGQLILAGSLADPVDGSAVLLFEADSPAFVEAFAAADPYVRAGVVTRWRVRNWRTVAGRGVAVSFPE
jgi:uncharacterized protein YciI